MEGSKRVVISVDGKIVEGLTTAGVRSGEDLVDSLERVINIVEDIRSRARRVSSPNVRRALDKAINSLEDVLNTTLEDFR